MLFSCHLGEVERKVDMLYVADTSDVCVGLLVVIFYCIIACLYLDYRLTLLLMLLFMIIMILMMYVYHSLCCRYIQ